MKEIIWEKVFMTFGLMPLVPPIPIFGKIFLQVT